mgnify:CR=1 FL=1
MEPDIPDAPNTTDDFIFADLLGDTPGNAADPLETKYRPFSGRPGQAGIHKRRAAKREMLRLRRREHLRDILDAPPGPGETYHIIGNSHFFFFDFVPNLLDIVGRPAAEFYASTWAMARPYALEMVHLVETGRIRKIAVVTGIYFKSRETATYSILLEGLRRVGGRYRAFMNHTKIFLLAWPEADLWIACESSANFSDNPRMENYMLTNDRPLYDFHRAWIEDILKS